MTARPRLRRIGGWLIALSAIALVFVVLSGSWLLRTESGRDFLLMRINNVLPEGATLTWASVQGTLSGPMEIRGIHYVDGGTRLDAVRLRVDYGLWPLFSRHLAINTAELEGAVLTLPRDDTPFELPRWPEVLPKLELPLTVSVRELTVTNFRIKRVDEPLLAISTVRSGFTIGDGTLHLDHLALASDRGDLSLSGDYVPNDNYRADLRGNASFPTTEGVAPARITLSAKGDFEDFRLAVDGNTPAPLRLRLSLKDGALPNWTFDASSEKFLLEAVGLPPDVPWAFELHATGQSGKAQLQGRVVRDGMEVKISPSRLALDQGVITLDPLLLALAQGPVRVDGTLALEGKDPRFDVRVGSPGLRLTPDATSPGAQAVTASGTLAVAGRWQSWTVAGNAVLARAREQAKLTIAGVGDSKQLRLDTLRVTSPTGSAQGKGVVTWQPQLGGSIDATLAGFDPGYFFPDYPGALSGRLVAKGLQDADGSWRADGRLSDLRGRLRNRPVSGNAQASWNRNSGQGELTLAIGDSRVAAKGRFGDTLDIHAQFSPLELSDLLADAGGRVTGRIDLTGARTAPSWRSDLQGTNLHWGEDKIASLSAQGNLPGRGRDGRLQLLAQGATIGGQVVDRIDLRLSGSLAALHVSGAVDGESGQLTIDATTNGDGLDRQGQLLALRLAPTTGAAWALTAPATYRYAAGSLRLSRACLRPEKFAGELCLQATGNQGSVQGEDLPLALIEPWLDDKTFLPFGDVSLDGRFARGAGGWGGDVKLRSARGGLRLEPNSPREVVGYSNLLLDAQLQNDRLSATLSAQLPEDGKISGRIQTGLAADAPLSGELTMDIHRLDWIELFSVDIANPQGQLDGRLVFGGTRAAPTIGGQAKLTRFSAELPGLGVKLQDGAINLDGDSGGSTRITGQVTSGKGVLRADGTLTPGNAERSLQLSLRGDNITAADTTNFEAVVSPDMTLTYGNRILQLRGVVVVPTARADLERLDTSLSASPDVVVLDPRDPPGSGNFLVDTDIEVRLGRQVRLKGYGLDGRLSGNLRVRDQPGRSAYANGTLEVSGRYNAYGQALQIRQGRLSWTNSPYDNPTLDIRAEREIEDVTAGVRVRGTALSPVTSVYSTPAMQPSEALSWLVLGRPLSSASGDEAQKLNASALALGAGSNLLAQQLGTKLGLDQAGITESRALGGSVLSVGKRISPKLFLSYGVSLVGTGQVITLKYLIKRGFNLSLESGTESAASLNWRKEK